MATTAKQTNNSRSLGLLGIVLILIGLGGGYYFLMPQLTQARLDLVQAESKLAGVNQDIETLKAAKLQLTTAKADLVAKGVDFSTVTSHYPVTENMPDMYIQMESLSRSATYVNKFEYTVAPPVLDVTTQVTKIPVSVTAIGQYQDLKKLIANIQNLVRPVIISTASINAYTNNDQPSGSFTLVLAGYSLVGGLSSSFAVTPAK